MGVGQNSAPGYKGWVFLALAGTVNNPWWAADVNRGTRVVWHQQRAFSEGSRAGRLGLPQPHRYSPGRAWAGGKGRYSENLIRKERASKERGGGNLRGPV